MTGRCYYLTTLGDWRRQAGRYAHSHFVVVDGQGADAVETRLDETARIIALIEADEGAHNALRDDPGFEALPHPLSREPVSERAQRAMGARGIQAGGASTFEAAEELGKIHPLLRHQVF